MSGIITGTPRLLIRLEALVVVAAASAAYARSGASWWLFAALFLVPDLSMLGYLAGRRFGAALYNAGHWYGLPAACVAWGLIANIPLALAIGLIWLAHIGFDRVMGYGLKYAEGFGVTHLGRVGKTKVEPDDLVATPA